MMLLIQIKINFLILKFFLNKIRMQYVNLIFKTLKINFLILNIKDILTKLDLFRYNFLEKLKKNKKIFIKK